MTNAVQIRDLNIIFPPLRNFFVSGEKCSFPGKYIQNQHLFFMPGTEKFFDRQLIKFFPHNFTRLSVFQVSGIIYDRQVDILCPLEKKITKIRQKNWKLRYWVLLYSEIPATAVTKLPFRCYISEKSFNN